MVRSRRVTANLDSKTSPPCSTLSETSSPPTGNSRITSGSREMYCPFAASMNIRSNEPSSPLRTSAASPSKRVICPSLPARLKFSLASAARLA